MYTNGHISNELVPLIVNYKHTILLWNPYIMNPYFFIVQASGGAYMSGAPMGQHCKGRLFALPAYTI
jgi:hypothetical protein